MALLGERIGKIRIVEELGEGGMGSLYVGFDEKLKRRVAIKVISGPQRFDTEAKTRFMREAKVLSKLEHSNICRIYDFLEQEQHDFLIMELIRGNELAEVAGMMSWKRKLEVAEKIAEALSVAHKRNIVHRDLKPGNIMITKDGEVKILDFGLARTVGELHRSISKSSDQRNDGAEEVAREVTIAGLVTELGSIMGTPMYMSPEQARGERVSAASDMYSFGLLLQWLFTGKQPYAPDLKAGALIVAASKAETEPVTGIDGDLTSLIKLLKSPESENRPTARETFDRLHRIRRKPIRQAKKMVLMAFVTLLILGSVGSTIGFYQASQERKRASIEAQNAKQTVKLLQEFLSSVNPEQKNKDLTVRDLLDSFRPKLDELDDRPLIQASLYFTYSTTYHGLGLYDESYTCAKKAHELHKQILGEAHPDSLASMSSIALTLTDQGKYPEAEELRRKCLTLMKRALGEEHPETLASFVNLASVLTRQGKYAEAEQYFRQCLDNQKRVLPDEHPDMLKSMNNLAVCLQKQEKFADAEQILLDCVEVKRRVKGEEHPETLRSLLNLGNCLLYQDKLADAETLYRQCVEVSTRVLGEAHPDTLRASNNLGAALGRQGKDEEAEHLTRRSLEIRTRVLGESHPATLESLNNLAWALMTQGKNLDEAEQLASSCLHTSIQVLGEQHPATSIRVNTLAMIQEKRGKIDEAISSYRKLKEIGHEAARIHAQEALKRLGTQE